MLQFPEETCVDEHDRSSIAATTASTQLNNFPSYPEQWCTGVMVEVMRGRRSLYWSGSSYSSSSSDTDSSLGLGGATSEPEHVFQPIVAAPAPAPHQQARCELAWLITSAVKRSIGSTTGCTITEKAPTRAFSWLKAATTAFTFKTLLRHYAKRALTPRSLNMKMGSRRSVWLA